MATKQQRSHVEVSDQEISLILDLYAQFGANWGEIHREMRKFVDKLPPPAKNLYEAGKFDKVRRRMADQIKKATKDGFVTKNPNLKETIENIKLNNQRYAKKQHPSLCTKPVASCSKEANVTEVCLKGEMDMYMYIHVL